MSLKLSDFDFQLPGNLIAQYPPGLRGSSRLLVLHREQKRLEHRKFKDVLNYVCPGDVLCLNETKVIPARLLGRRESTGGKVEVFLLREVEKGVWESLVSPGRRGRLGTKLSFGSGELRGKVLERRNDGTRLVRFECNGDMEEKLEELGSVPLPPYIKREPSTVDRDRYQTVYAKVKGAVAAPTAGLHFTQDHLAKLRAKSVTILPILLHVGLGTFRPVKVDDIREHHMEPEYYEIGQDAAEFINRAKVERRRVFAVGTTTVRALESAANSAGRIKENRGWTEKFIYPPYHFRIVDCLITNFHLPKSTLLMLVCAFAGRELMIEVYREAIEREYRFYSYGDAMLIL